MLSRVAPRASVRPAMKVFTTRVHARFAETDASGIVYYGNYFVYFELGRVSMFRELGLPYDKRVPIVETHCRYHAPARFGDLLEIRTQVDELRTRAFRLAERVYRVGEAAEPKLLAEGYTAMVTTDEAGTPIAIPEAFRAAFEAVA